VTTDFISAVTGKPAERKKTVAKYFDDWLENARAHLAHNTVTKYEQLVREFKAHVKADAAPVTMEDITPDDVRGYLTEKRKATTSETVKGFRRILSGIFLQAQNEGQTTRNPVALAKLPKTLTKEAGKRAFTIAEVKQLYGKATPFWKWMIRVSFFTGFSLGDLVTLRRLNVDLRQRTISIKRRKTGNRAKMGAWRRAVWGRSGAKKGIPSKLIRSGVTLRIGGITLARQTAGRLLARVNQTNSQPALTGASQKRE